MTAPRVGDGITSPGGRGPEIEGAEPKAGEFEEMLASKKAKPTEGARPARGRAEGGGPEAAGPGHRHGHATTRRGGRLPGPGGPEGRGPAGAQEAGSEAPPREVSARDAAAREALRERDAETPRRPGGAEARSLPGGLTAPHHTRWDPGAAVGSEVGAADATRGADAVARVERIAEQIVRAAEVRLHSDGAVEARMELDLGSLGRLNVVLERTAEGHIKVALGPTSAEGASLLRARGAELARRLEARGLNLRELRVESSGDTVLRVEGAAPETADAPPPTASAGEPASAEEAARQRQHRDEGEGGQRRRQQPDPEDDEGRASG